MKKYNAPLLQIKNLSIDYTHGENKKCGIENISLDFKEHEVVAILGRSGSGKSTLLKALSGLIPSSSGALFYQEKEVEGILNQAKLVFQNYVLLPWLTVYENVAFGLNAIGMLPSYIKERIHVVLNLIGLQGYEEYYPNELSGGMCQRVGFARAIITEPDILLLDEPFSALDAMTADQLRKEFFFLWNSRKISTRMIVMVTHALEEAIEYADRVLILSNDPSGIIFDEDTKELKTMPMEHAKKKIYRYLL